MSDAVELARSVPIEDELARRGIKLKRQGCELVGPCPLCGGSRSSTRFKVSPRKGLFRCFGGCDAGGDVISLVQKLDECTFKQAVKTLAGEDKRREDVNIRAFVRRVDDADREYEENQRKLARAFKIWDAAVDWRGTDGEVYLRNRKIDTDQIPKDADLRWHPACEWNLGTMPCLVARFTFAASGAAAGIQRIGVQNGQKVDKLSLGPSKHCVVRLWPDDAVTHGLVIGEGIETTLAAATRIKHKGTLLQPAWATCGTGNLKNFPVLSGIEALTILVDPDDAGIAAAEYCAEQWRAEGREVVRLTPNIQGNDFNDLIRNKSNAA
jgi:phage/plasmid primase-like uncharacterized protein